MNNVTLLGRLTADPETRYSQGENAIAITRFHLAVDRRFKRQGDEQTADFISCVSFGKTAEFIEKYFRKGQRLCCSGRIQTGSYTNKDGQKIYTTDVVVENAEFCENKSSSTNADASSNSASKSAPNPANATDGFMNIDDGMDDDELPFN